MCSEAQALIDWLDGKESVEQDDFLSSNERNQGLSCTDRMAKERYMRSKRKRVKRKAPTAPARGAKVNMRCHCGQHYKARKADILRNWGLSCSKRCAAIRREFGRPAATILGEE